MDLDVILEALVGTEEIWYKNEVKALMPKI